MLAYIPYMDPMGIYIYMRIRNPPRNSSKFPTLGRIRCAWRLFPEALAFGLALMVLPAWKWYILPMLHEAHEGHEDYATWKKMFRWNRWNPGWWFGTVFIFHFMYGIFIPTDWYFSRLLKPPTRTPFLIHLFDPGTSVLGSWEMPLWRTQTPRFQRISKASTVKEVEEEARSRPRLFGRLGSSMTMISDETLGQQLFGWTLSNPPELGNRAYVVVFWMISFNQV